MTLRMRVLATLLLLTAVSAFYSDTGSVVSLTASNFKTEINKGGYWIVEFYAPWCGHCQKLKPEYEKAAFGLKGAVNVAAVDCDTHKSLAGEYGVQGFPTIKLFYPSTKGTLSNMEYSGGRTANDIISWAMDQIKKLSLKRIGSKSEEKGEKREKKQKADSGGFYGSDSDVIQLGSHNFDKEVKDSEDLWMMEFYAPWCGHCKNLKSDWEQAATELKGKVKVGAVDCTAHESLCGEFGVQGFPTLKYFGSNKKHPEPYNGARDAASIVAFALVKWSSQAPPPEVKELTEPFILEKYCTGSDDLPSKQLCFIVFLPHILDSRAEGRNRYLAILQKVADHFKERPFGYLWAEAGKQRSMEQRFATEGFGYPAAVIFSPKRNAYTIMKAGMDYDHCVEFIDSIRHGFEKLTPLDGELPEAATTVLWDGKDEKVDIEEEFDLDEIMNDEL